MGEENISEVAGNYLHAIFGAIIGITLGLGISGAVLFTSAKALQYYWNM
jgi:tetrahydromethanopterin S-methyltransferase subunit B